MTKDLEQIKKGIAQARIALNLLEKLIGEYETRIVNILPAEDVKFYRATDDDIIVGEGVGTLASLNETLQTAAQEMAAEPRA